MFKPGDIVIGKDICNTRYGATIGNVILLVIEKDTRENHFIGEIIGHPDEHAFRVLKHSKYGNLFEEHFRKLDDAEILAMLL
jgi:hypothetical protein